MSGGCTDYCSIQEIKRRWAVRWKEITIISKY